MSSLTCKYSVSSSVSVSSCPMILPETSYIGNAFSGYVFHLSTWIGENCTKDAKVWDKGTYFGCLLLSWAVDCDFTCQTQFKHANGS